jgi:xylulokinase
MARKETGLTANTKVAVGGHDHITAALACDIVRPGDTINSIGTAETVMRVTDKLLDGRKVAETGLLYHHHVVKGKYYLACSLPNGSGTINWAFENIGKSENFENNLSVAMKAAPGCNGLLFIPHLLGSGSPTNDDFARGAFVGLRTGSTRADMLRAVHEGLVNEFKIALEVLDGFERSTSDGIVGVSGGFRNDLTKQLKVDMTGLKYVLPELDEASTLGAALLGGIAAGVYSSYEQAADAVEAKKVLVKPNSKDRAAYDKTFVIYKKLYQSLKSINHSIN